MMALALVLCASVAAAAGPRAARKQIERSMLVTGHVLVEPDGSVSGWEIDQREKLPDFVAGLIEKSAPEWKFEPVLVDGSPGRARARMSLRVVANQTDDGSYRVAIRSGYFGEEAMTPEERRRQADADDVRSLDMTPPSYPMQAAQGGVRGTVYLVVRVNRQGEVDDVAVEQVNLKTLGSEGQMTMMRNMLAQPAVRAARKWTFRIPTAGDSAGDAHWFVRVPVDYKLGGDKSAEYGQWDAYIPGPRQTIAWLDTSPDAGDSPDALVAGGVYMLGKGLKLLTPFQQGG